MDTVGEKQHRQVKHFGIEIDSAFIPYTAAAKLRFSIIYPKIGISIQGTEAQISLDQSLDKLQITREFRHCLYREKIYQETLDMRRGIVQALVKK